MQSWDDLRVFHTVFRAGSMTQAAQELRMDTATVSRRISRLELQIGRPLFVRKARGLSATSHAESLAKSTNAMEAAALNVLDSVENSVGSGMTGQIRIGAPDGCANFLLPSVIAELSKLYPNVDLQIVALPRVFNLSRREADLAIAVSPQTGPRQKVDKICNYHLHLAVSQDILLGRGAPKKLSDLSGIPTIGYIPDLIFDDELDYLNDFEMTPVQMSSNSVSVQCQMIAKGLGAGIVHDFALPFLPNVTKVLQEQVHLQRAFFLVQHIEDAQGSRRAAFVRDLKKLMVLEIRRLEARC